MPFTSSTVQESFGYLFVDEVEALKRLARGFQDPPTIVNIGAGAGTSGLAFIESRPDVWLYTVDIQDESSPFGCLQGERMVFESAGYSHLAGVRWFQIHGNSAEVGADWLNGNRALVDMVFIDADHSYEGCKADILSWLPNLKSGGILAVHDYRKAEVFARPDDGRKKPHPQSWPGVDQAVDEFLRNTYPTVLHVDSLIAFKVW